MKVPAVVSETMFGNWGDTVTRTSPAITRLVGISMWSQIGKSQTRLMSVNSNEGPGSPSSIAILNAPIGESHSD